MARFHYSCHLRWSDMDTLGHVNNVQYVRYLEDARVAMLFSDAERSGVSSLVGGLVVVRHEIDYRRPLVFRSEPVPIDLWVTRMSNSSFDLAYEMHDEGTVYLEAKSVIAPYDAASARARRIAPDERAWLQRYQ